MGEGEEWMRGMNGGGGGMGEEWGRGGMGERSGGRK